MGNEVTVEDKSQKAEEVSVLLDDKGNPIPKQEEKKPENVYVRPEDLEPIRKGQNYTSAALRKIQEDFAKLNERLTAPPPKQEPPTDEWDVKLQKDWKGTVKELAREEAKAMREAERAEEFAKAESARARQTLEENKLNVIKRHPELEDENSEKATIFKQIVQERPEYLSNPFGPVLAMRDMEDRLREKGILDEPVKRQVEKEVVRQTRTNAAGVKSSTTPSSNRIVLSKDEQIYCDRNGIKYENYAKMKQAGNSGVEA